MKSREKLKKKIENSVERAMQWLNLMDVNPMEPGIKKASSYHNVNMWPGMVLPATYNSVHCKELLKGWFPQNQLHNNSTGTFFNSCQSVDGFFHIKGMTKESIYKKDDTAYTWEYINFHISNYSLGALSSLGMKPVYSLDFMIPYLSAGGLKAWIKRREWDDPWMEGNNIVNLAGFFLMIKNWGSREAGFRFTEMMEWLNDIQNPLTGYWGDHSTGNSRSMLEAMAGASHIYHLYFYSGIPVPYSSYIIDSSLEVAFSQLNDVTSACLDIDIVDVLANLHVLDYRRAEVEDYLFRKLEGLLEFQNDDGGFCDTLEGLRSFDGWIKGYSEPQGISNCFATWFRMATIGMISTVLFPETANRWFFRETIGMGYFCKQ